MDFERPHFDFTGTFCDKVIDELRYQRQVSHLSTRIITPIIAQQTDHYCLQAAVMPVTEHAFVAPENPDEIVEKAISVTGETGYNGIKSYAVEHMSGWVPIIFGDGIPGFLAGDDVIVAFNKIRADKDDD